MIIKYLYILVSQCSSCEYISFTIDETEIGESIHINI
jgi:hypothetical protein